MSKHKYIETPEKLWELFENYRDNLKPRAIQKATNKGVQTELHTPPLTMSGFECYCLDEGMDSHNYFDNPEGRYEAYKTICSRIKKSIRAEQIEGGMAGIYNPSITQRLNGLKENVEESGSKELTIKVKYERKTDNPE